MGILKKGERKQSETVVYMEVTDKNVYFSDLTVLEAASQLRQAAAPVEYHYSASIVHGNAGGVASVFQKCGAGGGKCASDAPDIYGPCMVHSCLPSF